MMLTDIRREDLIAKEQYLWCPFTIEGNAWKLYTTNVRSGLAERFSDVYQSTIINATRMMEYTVHILETVDLTISNHGIRI